MAVMRHLLALLALISGLAALGAPVQASSLSAAALEVTGAEAAQSDKRKAAECRAERRASGSKDETGKECKRAKPVIIFIPTVQFGPDRAFE